MVDEKKHTGPGVILPPKRTIKESIAKFIYNREKNSILGRDAEAWARVAVFYFIFFIGLIALSAICMVTFLMHFIDNLVPRWQLHRSVIGTSPGMGFRPSPFDVKSTLISYKDSSDDYKRWELRLVQFLSAYKAGVNVEKCDFNKPPGLGKVCDVDIKLDPCTEEKHFSYDKSSPCIFVKLNKIYDWVPNLFNNTKDLPESMPKNLKDDIAKLAAVDKNLANMVWVSCDGVSEKDKKSLGPVKYLPYPGFPGYFYPYLNTKGYLSPLVALHLENPAKGVFIDIECRAWAKNIRYKRRDKQGSVRFALKIA